MGFSYNVLTSQGPNQDSESCIRSIEFNRSMLTVRTSGNIGRLYNFSLTLFIKLSPNIDFLQGYCTLNREGHVLVNFGDDKEMEWRNGRISAVLKKTTDQYRAVFMSVSGAKPGNKVVLSVATKKGLGKVNWCLGPVFSDSQGIKIPNCNTPIPISSFSYGNSEIVFQTGQGQSHNNTLDFSFVAYIKWYPLDLQFVYLSFSGNEGIAIKAQVGSSQPQLVSRTSTLFTI